LCFYLSQFSSSETAQSANAHDLRQIHRYSFLLEQILLLSVDSGDTANSMQPLFIIAVSTRATRLVAWALGVICQILLLMMLWFMTNELQDLSFSRPTMQRSPPRISMERDHQPEIPADYKAPELETKPLVLDNIHRMLDPIPTPEETTATHTDSGSDTHPTPMDQAQPEPAPESPISTGAQARRAAWKKDPTLSRMSLKRLPGMKNLPQELYQPRTVQAVYSKEEQEQARAVARLQELSGWHVHRRITRGVIQAFNDCTTPFNCPADIESTLAIRLIFDPSGTITATEVIVSTGYPELDQYLCTVMMQTKRIELPAQQQAGVVYSHTFSVRVRAHKGQILFDYITEYVPGMYMS
jgi:outer membrane biosynthesis protein TonB